MTLNKQKTALFQAYQNQTDTQVSRFMFAAPFISNTDYNNLMDDLDAWVAEMNNGNLNGTKEDNTTFTLSGIDTFPRPRR